MSLLLRIFLLNAAVLLAAMLALAFTPATVSSPILLHETVVLVGGLTAILVVNLYALRRAVLPLRRLADLIETVDLLRPGPRIPVYGSDREVARLTTGFNEMLERLERERRESLRRALIAQENERSRIARELHDEVGQSLTAVLLQLERAGRGAPPELAHQLVEARETAREGLNDVRAVAQRIRPEALEDLGLQNALAALCQRISEHSDLTVVHRFERDLPAISPEGELVVYRIAQEALTNTLRHAGASEAMISLGRERDRLVLRVSDDGSGLNGADPGAGISGMRERALLLGGELEVRSRPEGGVEVILAFQSRDRL